MNRHSKSDLSKMMGQIKQLQQEQGNRRAYEQHMLEVKALIDKGVASNETIQAYQKALIDNIYMANHPQMIVTSKLDDPNDWSPAPRKIVNIDIEGVPAKLVGKRADCLILDDVIEPEETVLDVLKSADSETLRKWMKDIQKILIQREELFSNTKV